MNSNHVQELFTHLQKRRINPSAFQQWKEYRDFLTDVIIHGSRQNTNIGLFGAGRCNDLDLHRLSEHFHTVVLIDHDLTAMREACKKYDIPEHGNVHIRFFDFVGLSQRDYFEFAETCCSLIEKYGSDLRNAELIERIAMYLEQLYEKATGCINSCGQYDCVVAAGVHSQLNEMAAHIWQEIMRFHGVEIDSVCDPVTRRINHETLRLVWSFDRLLFSSTKEKMFLSYEQGINGQRIGIHGAMQLQDDLLRMVRKGMIKITARYQVSWPQNLERNSILDMLVDDIQITGMPPNQSSWRR